MYDSVDWSAIPRNAPAIAGYADGPNSKWPDSAWQQFTTPRVLQVCTWGPRNVGNTLDIEKFDSVVEDARPYALAAMARGIAHPKLYMSTADFPAVREETRDLDVRYWVAHPTGTPHLYPGSHGTQWGWLPSDTGGAYDLSLCLSSLFD